MQNLNEQFPLDPSICYLNHAAVSPWPLCASEALKSFAQENVATGAQHYPAWLQTEQALREKLRALINADSIEEIALSKNTSEALSIIAYGLDWKDGDEVLISNEEFPSNRIVWESLKPYGVRVTEVDIHSRATHEALTQAISSKTRLISISTVQYASGKRTDWESLGKVCRDYGILLCLDAIQSLGALPFDQQKTQADFIVADGHKWMMGAEGLALLYVKQKHIPLLKLHQFGWHMVKQRGNYDLHEWEPANDATRFECGSPNMLGAQVLNASLGLLLDVGIDSISKAIQGHTEYLINASKTLRDVHCLSPENWQDRAGIVTLKPEDVSLATLHKALMNRGVVCAQRGGGIRFSPHFYTQTTILDRALNIFEDEIKRLR
ncbi:MAG: aminotransferase class V-fold PLP-dependent enzyme [Oleiphilaceae bacterium]|nr:aminotransferase class V-fold PLP-dependent enzyme [Oleiphilaceae bacterium]